MLFNPFDEGEKLSLQRGSWVVGVIETRIFWPKKKQLLSYNGKNFLLLPFDQTRTLIPILPAIAFKTDMYSLTKEDAHKEILHLASALSWREQEKLEVIAWTGGNLPRSMSISGGHTIIEYLHSEHLPAPAEELARKALALYREGVKWTPQSRQY